MRFDRSLIVSLSERHLSDVRVFAFVDHGVAWHETRRCGGGQDCRVPSRKVCSELGTPPPPPLLLIGFMALWDDVWGPENFGVCVIPS